MAHFAHIVDGVVTEVIVVPNEETPNESAGKTYINKLGLSGEWVQTSYNNNPIEGQDRGLFAGIGYLWDGSKFTDPNIIPVPLPEA